MTSFLWIVSSGVVMSAVALIGGVTLWLGAERLQRLLLPMVAFAAGTLIGGALLHMLPGAIEQAGAGMPVFLWVLAGFTAFLGLEQFLHWHHSHRDLAGPRRDPLTYLILIGDGLHNFLGGLAVAGAFIADVRLGISAWLAAVAHEVPQEMGDFAILVHGGWSRGEALLVNVLSALPFLLGGVLAYGLSFRMDVWFLLPFAAGNFLYIAAADLVPEIKVHHNLRTNLLHFTAFVGGIALLFGLRVVLHG
jgi:zinc and cadmium transporter